MDQFSDYNELFPPEILGMFLQDAHPGNDKHISFVQSTSVVEAQDLDLATTRDQLQGPYAIDVGLTSTTSTIQVIQEEPRHHRARRHSSSSTPSKLHRGSSCETCLSTEAAAGHCRKERRRQQNRVSQQKFREKKEAKLQKACEEISELQASVDSLRNEKKDLHVTNRALRLRIEELERSQAQISSPHDTMSASTVVCSPHKIQGTATRGVAIHALNEKSSECIASSVYSDVTVDIASGLTNVSGTLDQWFVTAQTFDSSIKVAGMKSPP